VAGLVGGTFAPCSAEYVLGSVERCEIVYPWKEFWRSASGFSLYKFFGDVSRGSGGSQYPKVKRFTFNAFNLW
jgi:hypothetical protein